MKVTLVAIGRFHHFHLARQLERYGLLNEIWSGFPMTRLRDEAGLRPGQVRSYPLGRTPAMLARRVPGLRSRPSLLDAVDFAGYRLLDRKVARSLREPVILTALSGAGLMAGKRAQSMGGAYVCDRGSSHIRVQNGLLAEESARWDLPYHPTDPRMVAQEEAEYAAADRITVPSQFVFDSFIEAGVNPSKIRLVPYGGRLDRFRPVAKPDPDRFDLLFVGGTWMRKGLPYLIEAFAMLRHPRKRLRIIGVRDVSLSPVLDRLPLDGVEFLDAVPNTQLAHYYSTAHALVLPSIEEGLAMVLGEAMACGCPVVATPNTGGGNLFTDGVEGRMVSIRSSLSIAEALQSMIDDPKGREQMGARALEHIQSLRGWDTYGDVWAELARELGASPA